MKNSVLRILVILLTLVSSLFVVSSCDLGGNTPDEPKKEEHVCEHACPVCGKCTDSECADSNCQEKCEGHQLSAPSISLSGQVVSWTQVANATSYEVFVNGVSKGSQTALSYTLNETAVGSYKVKVVAKADNYGSAESNEVTFTVAEPHACDHICPVCGKCTDSECAEPECAEKCQGHVLAAPVISIEDGLVSWTAVENASGYEVFVNGSSKGTQTSLEFDATTEEEGKYEITVKALGGSGYQTSAESNKVEHKFELVISFFDDESTSLSSLFVDSTVTYSADELAALLVDGISAKNSDFVEFDVKVKSLGELDATQNGTYTIVLAAYDAEGNIKKNLAGAEYTVERTIVVKEFTQLAAPANVAIGSGNDLGKIKFSCQDATSYVAIIVEKGKEANDESAIRLELSKPELAMGFVGLASGDYTVFFMGKAKGYKDSQLSAGFDITFTCHKLFDAEAIAAFGDHDHGRAELVNGSALITGYLDSWGKAISESFDINLDKNPIISYDIANVIGKFFSSIIIDGSEVSILGDTMTNDPVTKQFKAGSFGGTQSFKLIVGASGTGMGITLPTASLNQIVIFSLAEYQEPVPAHALANPSSIHADGANIAWEADSDTVKYAINIKVKGSEEAGQDFEVTKRTFEVASLPVGNYTITIKAIGDGVLTLDSEEASYDFAVKEYANWTAQQIGSFTGEGWESTSTVQYNSELGVAIINYDGSRDYGAVGISVADAPTIDLSKKPVVVMTNVKITGGYLARAFFGASSIISMQNDTIGNKEFATLIYKTWVNVDGNPIPGNNGSADAPKGVSTYRFLMGFVSGSSSRVELSGMRIVYVCDFSDTLEKCETPTEFKADGANIAWSSDALSYSFALYELNGEEAIDAGTLNAAQFNAAILPAGNYTLKVKGLGDGASTTDSDEASFNFTVAELASYTAADIADSSKFELKGGALSVSETDGVAAIATNGDSWGVWASKEAVQIDLSKKPVLVIQGLTLVNGCWLQRCFNGSTEIVMQNDTNGSFDNVNIVKNIWVNVDGNPISGNTGSKTEPAGTVDYKVGIGVASNGSITLKGLRIVTISEYKGEVQKVASPTDLALDGENISWQGEAEEYTYTITRRGTSEEVASDSLDYKFVQLITLPAGDYTFSVVAKAADASKADSLPATYDFSIKEYANWNAEAIGNFTGEGWESTSTVQYNSETGTATINHDGSRGYGAVGVAAANAPTIDLSKKPYVIMENVNITTGYLARAFFGTSNIIVMQNDIGGDKQNQTLIFKTWVNVDGNPIEGNTGSKTAPAGVGAYRFMMGFTCGNTSRVELSGMRIVYLCEYTEEAAKCETPSEFKADGANIAWSSDALSYSFELFELNGEEATQSGTLNAAQFNAAILPAGNYTLKVKGLGDGESTTDSDEASFNFTVAELTSYTAADIADSSKFELKGGALSVSETDGVATIATNGDSWGVWASKEAVQIDLSKKPVLVIQGLTLVNGCWLQRCFNGSTEIVMQNDTNGTFDNANIVKNIWVNVDGNPISGNTGSKTEPAGTVDYKVGIGVASNGSITLKGFRIVTISEYTPE